MGSSSPIKHAVCLLSYLHGILFVWVGIYTFHSSNMDGIGQVIFGLLLSAAGYVLYDEGDKSATIAAYFSFGWGGFAILAVGASESSSEAPLPTNIGVIVYSVVLIGVGYMIKKGATPYRRMPISPAPTYTSPYQRQPQHVSTPTKRTTTTNSTFNIISSSRHVQPPGAGHRVDTRTISKIPIEKRKTPGSSAHLDDDISDLLSMTGETKQIQDSVTKKTTFEEIRTRGVPQDDNVERWFKKGCDLLNLKKFDESIECFNKILQLNPENDNALAHKGYALCLSKRAREGYRCFHKAAMINPHNELALTNLIVLTKSAGDWEFNIACCDMLLQTNLGKERAEEIKELKKMAINQLYRTQ